MLFLIIEYIAQTCMLWTEYLCSPKMCMLKFWSPIQLYLEVDLWEVTRFKTKLRVDPPWLDYSALTRQGRDPPYLHHVRIWEKAAICKPGKGPSPDTDHAGTGSHFPTSKTVRYKCLSFKPLSLWYLFIIARTD